MKAYDTLRYDNEGVGRWTIVDGCSIEPQKIDTKDAENDNENKNSVDAIRNPR